MKTAALLVLAAGVLCSCSKKNNIPVVPTPPPSPPPTVQFDYIAKIEGFSLRDGKKLPEYEASFNKMVIDMIARAI